MNYFLYCVNVKCMNVSLYFRFYFLTCAYVSAGIYVQNSTGVHSGQEKGARSPVSHLMGDAWN